MTGPLPVPGVGPTVLDDKTTVLGFEMAMARYTHGHEASVVGAHALRTAATSAAYLLPHLREGVTLLDVGCGPGSVTLDLAEAVGATGRVVGVDTAPSVLATARAAAAGRRDTRTTFEVADVFRLPFGDGAFDVVHAHQVLQHVDRPVEALREMARVCRPGGLVAARDVDFGATTWWPEVDGVRRWLELYVAVARANGGEPHAGRRLASWAERAGLGEVGASGSAWTYTTAHERAWLSQSWASRLRESLKPQAVGLGWSDAEVEYIAQEWLAWGNEPSGWFAFLHAEVLARVPG